MSISATGKMTLFMVQGCISSTLVKSTMGYYIMDANRVMVPITINLGRRCTMGSGIRMKNKGMGCMMVRMSFMKVSGLVEIVREMVIWLIKGRISRMWGSLGRILGKDGGGWSILMVVCMRESFKGIDLMDRDIFSL